MTYNEQIDRLLENIVGDLDIPDEVYEDAVIKYTDIAEFLSADDSSLKKYSPDLFPQGSFRLGTVVMPQGRHGEYDIDLVCKLDIKKESISQADLKKLVGDRLEQHDKLDGTVKPSRRCWVIEYDNIDNCAFHMDVLPSIPNREAPPEGILLTDTELTRWQYSNPKEYANWFFKQMEIVLRKKKQLILDEATASIEDVPEWKVKTPLQRAVQILKRHRDIYFGKSENRPVSIIITTLAARAYQGEENTYDAIRKILSKMKGVIQFSNEKWIILNPVEPGENFADKWNEYPARRIAFFAWLDKAIADFDKLGYQNYDASLKVLNEAIGSDIVKRADDNTRKGPSYLPSKIPPKGPTTHARIPWWNVKTKGNAKISCNVYKKKNDVKPLWPTINRGVPKNVYLKFVVRVDNISMPYQVFWQVTNTGKYAKEPRGEIFESVGSRIHENWEHTSYSGTHEVKAYIVKNEECVAMASIDVPIR